MPWQHQPPFASFRVPCSGCASAGQAPGETHSSDWPTWRALATWRYGAIYWRIAGVVNLYINKICGSDFKLTCSGLNIIVYILMGVNIAYHDDISESGGMCPRDLQGEISYDYDLMGRNLH